jgi:cell division protein FtsW
MFHPMGERTSVEHASRAERRRASRQLPPFLEALFNGTVVKPNLPPSPPIIRRFMQLPFDASLVLVVIILIVYGLMMIYSASTDFSMVMLGEKPTYLFNRQLIWLGLGISAAVFLTFFDYHWWKRLAVPAMGVTLVMLLVVVIAGEEFLGSRRGLFARSIQPSEVAKMMTIIYLAVWLFAKRERLTSITLGLLPLAAILGIVGGLIWVQPDISAMATVIILGGLMFYLAGGEIRQIAILLLISLVVGLLVVQISSTGNQRISDFLNGWKDPAEGSYHVQRSFEAFAKGGWLGRGIGNGETKYTGLPFPATDSIFAVIGEETGVIGTVFVVALYSLFLWRGLTIAKNAPDQLGALIAAGLTFWITTEAFLNMAGVINLLPVTGNVLPLFSAGGTNMTVTLAAIGILLNISRLSVKAREENGRTFNAVIDLRRGDGRRRVSSTRRASVPRKRL